MNRLVEGHGVKGSEALYQDRGKMLGENGYDPMLEALAENRPTRIELEIGRCSSIV